MTHAELVALILAMCEEYRLLAHYCRDSRHCEGKGFPDLVIAGPCGQLYAEVKGHGDIVRPEQTRWHRRLRVGGARVAVFYPHDLANGNIDRELVAVTSGPPRS